MSDVAPSGRHEHFLTTTRGLNRDTPPMRLFEQAKKFGIWNPADIDFDQDKRDWQSLQDDEQDVVLRLTAMLRGSDS